MLAYAVEFERDDNDTFLVTCPALPEVTTFGTDESDAIKHAEAAIEEAIAARMAGGRDVPPTSVTNDGRNILLPMMTSLKVDLYNSLREKALTRADLVRLMTERNKKVHREQVDRLFRLDHASRMDQIEAAFDALEVPVGFSRDFIRRYLHDLDAARRSLAPLVAGQMYLGSKSAGGEWRDITAQRIRELREEISAYEEILRANGVVPDQADEATAA